MWILQESSSAISERRPQGRRLPPPGSSRAHVLTVEFQDVESGVAVHDIDKAPGIDVDVVGLRRRFTGGGLGDEVADLARSEGIGDIHDAQASGKPRAVNQRVLHVLLELVRAGASVTTICGGLAAWPADMP